MLLEIGREAIWDEKLLVTKRLLAGEGVLNQDVPGEPLDRQCGRLWAGQLAYITQRQR